MTDCNPKEKPGDEGPVRVVLRVRGIVQGVGFRPFVYGLARSLSLTGWVLNDSEGVLAEVQGPSVAVEEFRRCVADDAPPMAKVIEVACNAMTPIDETDFVIRPSETLEARRTLISPDTATCDDCLAELFDPKDRRFGYPFINCTHCGPRYTIIRDIPYDRPYTTMAPFVMCPDCQGEYDNPGNRRFHAQPNACAVCGPRLALLDGLGEAVEVDNPLARAAQLLGEGRIVAVKGLGGFHLVADALNAEAVLRLRRRKHREEKPFAVMVTDVASASRHALVSDAARRVLASPERPIVLLPKRADSTLAEAIAPRSRMFGLMLPYTPLHHVLMSFGFEALVMTSGNQTDEPIAIDNDEAVARLGHIADAFVVHDRDIYLRSDDSVVRSDVSGLKQMRRSRGYVPVPIPIADGPSVLALGAELKNTICLTRDDLAFVSQHIGDLENLETYEFFLQTVKHLSTILDVEPEILAHDMHPQYMSTIFARKRTDLLVVPVQHHHAHAVSAMVEHGLTGEALAVIWDGTGFGLDGRTWGSEFLRASATGFERLGHMKYMMLPGGDAAVREPWRAAVAALWQVFGQDWRDKVPESLRQHEEHFALLERMLRRGINCPETCGAGRLFDIISGLTGVCRRRTYEGQPAIELEAVLNPDEQGAYDVALEAGSECWVLDWSPTLRAALEDTSTGVETGVISARFHNGLVNVIVELVGKLREGTRLERVVLSGGVFQNQYLSEQVVPRLKRQGFEVFEQMLLPANDGGISLGQAAVARALTATKG